MCMSINAMLDVQAVNHRYVHVYIMKQNLDSYGASEYIAQ